MTSDARDVRITSDLELDFQARLSSVNAVFTLSLILTQASSPGQVMRLVTTAVPSVARCEKALAWHSSKSGDYFERAPDSVSDWLAGLTGPGQLHVDDVSAWWAFPMTSPLAHEPIFLMVASSQILSDEETFLLSVLAQLCGTVIARLELITAERASTRRVAALNSELETTVSALTKIMEIHRRLNEIVTSAGETGIAETLHQLTTFPVLIQDVAGNTRATAGEVPGDHLGTQQPQQRRELISRLRVARRALYHRQAWLVLANARADVVGVVALIDPGRTASSTDLAAL
jgi:hypothetical protein